VASLPNSAFVFVKWQHRTLVLVCLKREREREREREKFIGRISQQNSKYVHKGNSNKGRLSVRRNPSQLTTYDNYKQY